MKTNLNTTGKHSENATVIILLPFELTCKEAL